MPSIPNERQAAQSPALVRALAERGAKPSRARPGRRMRGSVALLFAAAGSACADPPPDPWTTVPGVDNPAPADRLQLVADPIAAPVLPGLATARFADDRGALLVLVPEMRAVRVDKFGGQPGKAGGNFAPSIRRDSRTRSSRSSTPR